MTEPLTAIEETTAHHAAAIDDISTQMADQWAAIRRLETQVERLLREVLALREEQDAEQGHGDAHIPPHY